MPTYVLRNNKTGEVWEVNCSYSDLEDYLAHKDIQQIIKAPSMVTDTKSVMTRAGSDWQDHLKRIKKSAGRKSTIKV